MLPGIGPMEIVVVLIVALIVIGPKKLPDMGKSLGKGMREFKNAVSGDSDDKRDSAPQLTAATDSDEPVETPAPKSAAA